MTEDISGGEILSSGHVKVVHPLAERISKESSEGMPKNIRSAKV